MKICLFLPSQLKAYAAAQGVILYLKATEHIGYSLNSNSTTPTNLLSYGKGSALCIYFTTGTILYGFLVAYIMSNLKSTVEKLSKFILDQLKVWKVFCGVAVITMLIELGFEFAWCVVWSKYTDSSSKVFIWVTYFFIRFIPLMAYFIISLVLCYKHNYGFSGVLLTVFFMLAIMIYWFALPTFLFLLVYPINVVAVFAYMTAFMFTLIVSITIFWSGYKIKHLKRTKLLNCTYILYTFISVIYLFLVLVIVLFIIAIGKTSVITFSFYGVLSLLPSVAITAVSWMFKNKVFKEGDENNEPIKEKSEPGNENNEPGNEDNEPGTVSELHLLIDPKRNNTSGTYVHQRTHYQTMGEQST